MKLIGLVLLLMTFLLLWWCSQPGQKYDGGKDTYENFGEDSTYTLLRNECDFINNQCVPEKTLTLYDNQNRRVIQVGIVSYKEIEPYLYVVGGKVNEVRFALLNYQTGYVKKDTRLERFSQPSREIFRELLAHPIPGMTPVPGRGKYSPRVPEPAPQR